MRRAGPGFQPQEVTTEEMQGPLGLATRKPLGTLAGAVSVAKREVRLRANTEFGCEREMTSDAVVGDTQGDWREGFSKMLNAGGQEPMEKIEFS